MVLKGTNDTKLFWVDGKFKAIFYLLLYLGLKVIRVVYTVKLIYLGVISLNKSNVEYENCVVWQTSLQTACCI